MIGICVARKKVVGFQIPGFAFEPFRQFVRIRKNASALSARNAMHRQSALSLPTLDGALGTIEIDGNLFPGDKRLLEPRVFSSRGSHGSHSGGPTLQLTVYAGSYFGHGGASSKFPSSVRPQMARLGASWRLHLEHIQ